MMQMNGDDDEEEEAPMATTRTPKATHSYPLPACLRVCPGGRTFGGLTESDFYLLSEYTKSSNNNNNNGAGTIHSTKTMDRLVHMALSADDRLWQYTAYYCSVQQQVAHQDIPHFLPSLSVLAEAVFGRLTGCAAKHTKDWADAMILQYGAREFGLTIPADLEEIGHGKPAAFSVIEDSTTAAYLKQLLKASEARSQNSSTPARPRPCGYVFKRGDIAWNCRTCQTDATCVICDDCFRNSNHEGHEVYFHRTTPGGCCDCGDVEAWNPHGCCDRHRPTEQQTVELTPDDPMEAVRMAKKGLREGIETLQREPTALPPRLAAALGVVIGAAVRCLVDAVDGSGIGADPIQWKMRWADEASKILNGATCNEEYSFRGLRRVTPVSFLEGGVLPDGYELHLRLHNDDVHTFDEVIDALFEQRQMRRNMPANEDPVTQPLVMVRERANEMTQHVDADGQVEVRKYKSIGDAMRGYRRLKSRGLHCSVVSTAQLHLEARARVLSAWLTEISAAHPAAAAMVVHALVQVNPNHEIAGVRVWEQARTIPVWAAGDELDEFRACRRKFEVFPPHLPSSYLSHEESELLHGIALTMNSIAFVEWTGGSPSFYSTVPYRLPSERYHKSPHALWGTLPSSYSDSQPLSSKHPLLQRLLSGSTDSSWVNLPNHLTEIIFVVDTDLRKQQEAERLTSSVFPHRLPGLNIISGIGSIRPRDIDARRPALPSPMDFRHLISTSSFRAPLSPILLLLLLDPYPTKQLRATLHALFLSLLTDSRFKSRFAGALAIAYRPLSTLFCAGVGTEADTPLHFTVQIFTAGSLVRALGNAPATEKLLLPDEDDYSPPDATIGVFALPIGHMIARCIHTNLLGSTKEVNMILNNTSSGNNDKSDEDMAPARNDAFLPALTYVAGEHPLLTQLPAAPDDCFLDSRSTRHKRLPHLLRDLEYILETPGTSIRLLLPQRFPVYQGPSLSFRGEDVLAFSMVFSRMLRLAQGIDPQKRKISGGHVEYEQSRWLEAFGLSLNLAGARDALAESPSSAIDTMIGQENPLGATRDAMGNIISALLRELKFWLYREGMLESGFPVPSGGAHSATELAQIEALQRSTLHVSGSQGVGGVALSCATGIKMTEAQLNLIENSIKVEAEQRRLELRSSGDVTFHTSTSGPALGDWLRVPHSPYGGDSLSFHLPLHRAIAKCLRSICSVVVPDSVRSKGPAEWWKLPVLDTTQPSQPLNDQVNHPLVPLIRSSLRSSNCRVVWIAGPDCTPQEAQRRRSRSRSVSAHIAVAKVIHSLADHPIRCLAAAQQIDRHLWARNGSSVAGMAMNYSSTPLCRSFRDLDLLLAQFSAAGMSCGLGARRVFNLLLSRFSMDGYLCDPERRTQSGTGSTVGTWVNPPRLQDTEHAVVLAESFFSTVCVLVTELPPPPPSSLTDDSSLRQSVRRELIHALAAEPRSHSEAMTAASSGLTRREESEGGAGGSGSASLFRETFTSVLSEVGKQKTVNASRASSGPPAFELKPEFCDEYDPTYYHLRRPEHQHAMDVVAQLRRQKLSENRELADAYCFPLVCAPPKAHPRFLPCRLVLHLPAMDAAIRRSLLFALTSGSWLPPPEPVSDQEEMAVAMESEETYTEPSSKISSLKRRLHFRPGTSPTSFLGRQSRTNSEPVPFSREVVAASSVSFLEVLQLLTLQAHTLEECASLHLSLPDLDDEGRALSSGLSINSYLSRLVWVPDSLINTWALLPFPEGPLMSRGSGENRGSILGLLIALYEHRADHGAILDGEGGEYTQSDDGHGGARALASSGLKWLLRFIDALVGGASTVGAAIKSATTGIPIATRKPPNSPSSDPNNSLWTIDETIKESIGGMLANLNELWPQTREKTTSPDKPSSKSKEAQKAAQSRVMEMMKRKQAEFAATLMDVQSGDKSDEAEGEIDLCIICRCDDADGENNGPLGYLGHVQRSRSAQLRAVAELSENPALHSGLPQMYRVIGHMGCQLRESEAMDSKPLSCLPKGSVVSVIKSKVSDSYGILSRRVLVRHVEKDSITGTEIVIEGWASLQSSQGYVILSPLVSICYNNTRWGPTRPIIRQCGHAAHVKCVEAHTLSLHQRAAGEQPYDGRFAANIVDGEFLCPLCKQLSNILIPRDLHVNTNEGSQMTSKRSPTNCAISRTVVELLSGSRLGKGGAESLDDIRWKAFEDFGSHIYNAMSIAWDKKRTPEAWHRGIERWDYEETDNVDPSGDMPNSVLRFLRQLLISWASVGHSAGVAEASTRGVEEKMPFGTFAQTTDPWSEFDEHSQDTNAMLVEMKRNLTGISGLFEVMCLRISKELASVGFVDGKIPIVSKCLADVIDGRHWVLDIASAMARGNSHKIALWSELTSLTSAMPCHVSRDGTLPHRCEARATASAMWAFRGAGSPGSDEVAAPLAIQQVFREGHSGYPPIPIHWGTMNPFVDKDAESDLDPFRPGIACAFLYIPLLAWDLNTLAGAILSCLLTHDTCTLPTNEELLDLVRILAAGRIIQSIATPGGFEIPDEMDVDDDECWNAAELEVEGKAIRTLVAHCRAVITSEQIPLNQSLKGEISDEVSNALLAGVGRAILPFLRALILMVRAFVAAVRERQMKCDEQNQQVDSANEMLKSLLFDRSNMEAEDGFEILKKIQGPTPSSLIDPAEAFWPLINKWLASAIAVELHHGSRGRSLVPTIIPGATDDETKNDTIDAEAQAPKQSDNKANSSNESEGDYPMEIDQVDRSNRSPFGARDMRHNTYNLDFEESDDDGEDSADMDEAEEVVDIAGQIFTAFVTVGERSSDDPAESEDYSSSAPEGYDQESDRKFAHVARSPILYDQPSLLGISAIGPGRRRFSIDVAKASSAMADLSHLGSIHRKGVPTFSLIRLPKSFVELYNYVNKVKGREDITGMEDSEDIGNAETAICLLTGTVMRSGSNRRQFLRSNRMPGACTLHARKNGSGIGIFFLVQKCTVLLMHNNKSAYSPSLYVDEHGEEDPGLRRGRPLFLNEARYRALEMLWRQQGIPREVAQIRSTSDRVIRDNWY